MAPAIRLLNNAEFHPSLGILENMYNWRKPLYLVFPKTAYCKEIPFPNYLDKIHGYPLVYNMDSPNPHSSPHKWIAELFVPLINWNKMLVNQTLVKILSSLRAPELGHPQPQPRFSTSLNTQGEEASLRVKHSLGCYLTLSLSFIPPPHIPFLFTLPYKTNLILLPNPWDTCVS